MVGRKGTEFGLKKVQYKKKMMDRKSTKSGFQKKLQWEKRMVDCKSAGFGIPEKLEK